MARILVCADISASRGRACKRVINILGAVLFDAGAKTPRMIVGIGMDLAEVARYRFDDKQLAWFSRKVYTEEEMAYALRKRNRAERLAGFFAAKEATRKAFGHAIPWRSVGVSHERTGKPIIRLFDDAAALLERRSVAAIHLTITHTALMAAAVVVLEGLP
jgi:holo-[acyl-carrier protein] synthase